MGSWIGEMSSSQFSSFAFRTMVFIGYLVSQPLFSFHENKVSTIRAYTASSASSTIIYRADGIYFRRFAMHVSGIASLCNFDLDTFPPSALAYVSILLRKATGIGWH